MSSMVLPSCRQGRIDHGRGAGSGRDGWGRRGELAAGRHRALPGHPLPLRRRHRVHPLLAAAGIAVRHIGNFEGKTKVPAVACN